MKWIPFIAVDARDAELALASAQFAHLKARLDAVVARAALNLAIGE